MKIHRLPVNLLDAVLCQIGIGFAEMAAAEETVVGRTGRGMGGGENEMLRRINQWDFGFRIAAPQHEDQMVALLTELADDGIGEDFPSLVAVRTGLMGAYREDGVHGKYTLFHPAVETAGSRYRLAQVIVDFLEDIFQGTGNGDAFGDGEADTII